MPSREDLRLPDQLVGQLGVPQDLAGGGTLGIAVLGTVFLHGHSVANAFWLAAALVTATAVTTTVMIRD